jgi:tripartite-type tricarboxylate transporter receptor subunit TctC
MNCSEVKFVFLTLVFILIASPTVAAEYPSKPISFVIPWPAGGSTDVTGRALAEAVKKHLAQPVIVENKPGGGGTVGPSLVVSKPADGYTLCSLPSVAVAVAWHMGKLNFNPIEDVTRIIRYTGYVYGIVVRTDAPWKSIQDFVTYVKANPNKITYGSPGVGSAAHLAMEEFAFLTGIKMVHVPYKGGAETNTALLGGHVDTVCDSTGWAPLVDSGKFRLLATYGQSRPPRFSQVPTLREAGYDVTFPSPLEVVGPKGLPGQIVQKLHEAFKNAMGDGEYQAVLKKFDMSNLYLSPEDSTKASLTEIIQIGRIVQKLGLQKK